MLSFTEIRSPFTALAHSGLSPPEGWRPVRWRTVGNWWRQLVVCQGWQTFKMASGDLFAEPPWVLHLRFDVLGRGVIQIKCEIWLSWSYMGGGPMGGLHTALGRECYQTPLQCFFLTPRLSASGGWRWKAGLQEEPSVTGDH